MPLVINSGWKGVVVVVSLDWPPPFPAADAWGDTCFSREFLPPPHSDYRAARGEILIGKSRSCLILLYMGESSCLTMARSSWDYFTHSEYMVDMCVCVCDVWRKLILLILLAAPWELSSPSISRSHLVQSEETLKKLPSPPFYPIR